MPQTESVDKLLNGVGMGKWQVLGMVANFIFFGLSTPLTVGSAFWNPPLQFHCCQNVSFEEMSFSAEAGKKPGSGNLETNPFNNQCLNSVKQSRFHWNTFGFSEKALCTDKTSNLYGTKKNSYSDGFTVYSTNLKTTCPFVAYDRHIFISTFMSEFNLICEHSVYLPFFQDLFVVGRILGCLFGGDVGDRLGRVQTMFFASILQGIGIILVAFTANFPLILLGRFIVGLTSYTVLVALYTWCMETSPTRHRVLVGMLPGFFNAVGLAIFALLGYFIRSWRLSYIAITWPALVMIPALWFMDESPRWLLQQGRLKEASEIVWKAAKLNKSALESKERIEAVLEEIRMPDSATEQPQHDRIDLKTLFLSPSMRYLFIAVSTAFFLDWLQHYATYFSGNEFAGTNVFLFLGLTGALDGIANLAGIPIGQCYGRKNTTAYTAILSGLLVLIFLAIPDEIKWLQWVLLLGSLLFISVATQTINLYTQEIFPTVCRARGLAWGYFFGHMGTLAGPFVANNLGRHRWWIPGVVMGLCGLTFGLLTLTFPETKDRPLCETVSDVEKRAAESKRNRKAILKINFSKANKVGPANLEENVNIREQETNYSSCN